MFDVFMLCSLQEVEHERLSHLEVLKDEHINLAVSRLPALITSRWSDEAITAVAPIVEALVEVAGLANIEYFTIGYEEIDPSTVISGNGEATERPQAELMELPASFVPVQLLLVELQDLAMFVSLRDERLNELETVAEKDNLLLWFMRF